MTIVLYAVAGAFAVLCFIASIGTATNRAIDDQARSAMATGLLALAAAAFLALAHWW